jgi:hypothetical protein
MCMYYTVTQLQNGMVQTSHIEQCSSDSGLRIATGPKILGYYTKSTHLLIYEFPLATSGYRGV